MTLKHFITIVIGALSFNSIASGQFFNEGRTDLQENNLKGPVVQVLEKRFGIKEAFGEWEKEGMIDSDLMIFDNAGRFLMVAHTKTAYVDGVGRGKVVDGYDTYTYDEFGRITSIEELRTPGYLYNILEDLSLDYVSLIRDYGSNTKEFEYNSNGTIKAVTTKKNDWEQGVSAIIEKEIYKYNDDGYEVWFYNASGRRVADKICALYNEKRILQHGQDGRYITELFDEDGREIAYSNALLATNGELTGETFISYNDNGDLLALSSSIDVVKSIKGLESLSPFIGDRTKQSSLVLYEYEYDSYDNWIVQKAYTIRRDELIVSDWWEREITYSTESNDGEAIVNSIVTAAEKEKERERKQYETQQEEIERKRQEKEEWDARPIYSSLPETFGPWLVSQLTYPEESTALGSVLKARGSNLRIRVSLSISAEGKIAIRDCEWNLRNEKVYLVGGKKESDQAELEAKEYVESFQRIMTNAPIGKKGKEDSRSSVTIVLRDGTIKEGY